jgi:twitching motility protein PilT
MRDAETISAALTAAETGHLVLATLHTNDAVQSIDRIIDAFPSHQQNPVRAQLAASLIGVVAQRLSPRLDADGRIACFEIMLGTMPVRALIRDARTHQMAAVMETQAKDGMITMDKALANLFQKKLIGADAIRAISRDASLTGLGQAL